MNVLALSCKKFLFNRCLLINTKFNSFSKKKEETPKSPGKQKFTKFKNMKTSTLIHKKPGKQRAFVKNLPSPNKICVK